eukprot:GGOE01060878.1.p1 GENE.GGOE01060878.1~~GGOE01060878.1.p1  ORF type:complete len:224 (+),score=28.02 GGOE01060878.1:65-673(+)
MGDQQDEAQSHIVETCRSLNSLLQETLAHGPPMPTGENAGRASSPRLLELARNALPAQRHQVLLQSALDSALDIAHVAQRHGSSTATEGLRVQQCLLGRACESGAEALAIHQQLVKRLLSCSTDPTADCNLDRHRSAADLALFQHQQLLHAVIEATTAQPSASEFLHFILTMQSAFYEEGVPYDSMDTDGVATLSKRTPFLQ